MRRQLSVAQQAVAPCADVITRSRHLWVRIGGGGSAGGGDGQPSVVAVTSVRAYHSSRPIASPGNRGMSTGRHAMSKASGRTSAMESPLRFDEVVRERMQAAERQQRQQEGKATPSLSTSPNASAEHRSDGTATRFASTRSHRHHGRAAMPSHAGAPTRPHSDGASVHGQGGETIATARRDAAEAADRRRAALVLPYSEFAYRSRLQHARVTTLLELVEAPYAPSPLQVLLDVLHEAHRLQAVVSAEEPSNEVGHGGAAALVPLEASDESSRFSNGGPSRAQRKEAKEALQRLSTALARAQDVRRVLSRVVESTDSVASAAEVIGDRDSMAELEATLKLVDKFAETILASSSEKASFQLSDATYAETLHALLALSKSLGTHLTAVTALEELIRLSEGHNVTRAMRAPTAGSHQGTRGAAGEWEEEESEDEFSLDNIVSLVDQQMQEELRVVSAADHLSAMESCRKHRNFDLALSLYRRFMQQAQAGAFTVTVAHLSEAITAVAHCSSTSVHFEALQELLISSDAASTVPVSVPLYTSLIEAVSRATDNPKRMAIALALYRRLRDGQLTPTADTYAALIACCASTREPTHAFAFYQEARQVCGVSSFTPQLYTNLLLSYTNAGYGVDARRTLDVLVEAGAPLTRAAFHAALAGAETLREAQEIVEMMTRQYAIQPTPHTYAYLVHAATKEPKGSTTALQLFDLHEDMLASLLESVSEEGPTNATPSSLAASSTSQAIELEAMLQERYPHYVRAVEHAVMRLRLDPTMDPRLGKYLTPLLRIAQQRMNRFTGGMAPQAPTRIPPGVDACIAVLAPDVLANLDEWVEPFVGYYSAIVIPYSSLLALQSSTGRRVEGLMVKGTRAGLFDPVWTEAGDEKSAVVEHRRRRLVKFLQDYKDVIHLVSLEEELRWSRDVRRYNISTNDWFARTAAFAINLARRDIPGDTKLYAQHDEAALVLVSADFDRCGRYVVDLKRAHSTLAHRGKGGVRKDNDKYAGLREGLEKVFYHNPLTRPAWTPPKLSILRQRAAAAATHPLGAGNPPERPRVSPAEVSHKPSSQTKTPDLVERRDSAEALVDAEELYRQQLAQLDSKENEGPTAGDNLDRSTSRTARTLEKRGESDTGSPVAYGSDDALDADLLMTMLSMDDA